VFAFQINSLGLEGDKWFFAVNDKLMCAVREEATEWWWWWSRGFCLNLLDIVKIEISQDLNDFGWIKYRHDVTASGWHLAEIL
jgi:hypothetical protein